MTESRAGVELFAIEQYGSDGDVITFIKHRDNIISVRPKKRFFHKFSGISNFFKEVLLPYGYPESVSEDYLEYQIWDTFQAFCSTIIGAFKTRAVLKSVGVGDSNANAISAATTWILKDGTGMFGRILFAWWKGSGLDCDCKKWRFFADILNDTAMLMELCLCFYSSWSMLTLCVTATMYSIVGIAGGATRASITSHQAKRDNMAEISAKDGSQETVVNLIGSFGSIFLLNYITSASAEWFLILVLIILHLYTNYKAVKVLTFDTFNDERMALALKIYFTVGTVRNPPKVNVKESVLLGCGLKIKELCGFEIVMGASVKKILKSYSAADLLLLRDVYKNTKYMLFVSGKEKKIYVALSKYENTSDVIAAYFHATCLGIATSIFNSWNLGIYSNRQLRHPTPVTRLISFMKNYERHLTEFTNIPPHYLLEFNEFMKQENAMFSTALTVNDWNVDSHNLDVGEYRMDWRIEDKKNS